MSQDLVATLELQDIPPWSSPRSFKTKPVRNPKYEIDTKINSLVSFLPEGDITRLKIDAIMNPSDPSITDNERISPKIVETAGFDLRPNCRSVLHRQPAPAAIKHPFNLPSKP
jgi:hypothetical protein